MTIWWAYQVARHSENLENFCECNEQINFLVIQNLFERIIYQKQADKRQNVGQASPDMSPPLNHSINL